MDITFAVMLIGVAGVGAQWFAWRFNLPAIVLMAIAGVVLGPFFGILRPEATFGDVYSPLISMAVGVILFEGGLQLKFDELREVGRGVGRLVFPGVLIAWGLGFFMAYEIAGLSMTTALLFSGIMIVTGPTVIMPLLRQAKLSSRPATLLRWEGIVNDPIGALLAVVVYEIVHLSQPEAGFAIYQIVGSLLIGAVFSTLLGYLMGVFVAESYRRGWVPEFLKTPVLLTLVLTCFALANAAQEEGGLLAVTAMGVTIANAKLTSINQLRLFKENIAVLFVSGVFVMLTANLTTGILFSLGWRDLLFVAAMLVIVRPLTALISLWGTETTMKERALIGWIAPRGIVAVAVSGLFAAKMVDLGIEDGGKMVPLAFAMVFATVIAHGFSIAPLAQTLGLAQKGRSGVLIVGSSEWSAALGEKIRELKIPVIVVDSDYRRLRPARNRGLDTFYGEILSEVTEHHIELVEYGTVLAVSGNESHNALVCVDLAPEMDSSQTYQLSSRGQEEHRRNLSYTVQGRPLFHKPMGLDDLLERTYKGWRFQWTRISEAYPGDTFLKALGEEGFIVAIEREEQLLFSTAERTLRPKLKDKILTFAPPRAFEEKPEPERTAEEEELEKKKEQAMEKIARASDLTGG